MQRLDFKIQNILVYHLLKISAGERCIKQSFFIDPLTKFYDKAIYKSVLIIKSLKVKKINFSKNKFLLDINKDSLSDV